MKEEKSKKKRQPESELQEEIVQLLNIENDYDAYEVFDYLEELDYELKRLIRNILTIKKQIDTDGAILKDEKPFKSRLDNLLLYYLEKNGFVIKEEDVFRGGKRFHIFEGTLEEVLDHRLLERDDMIIIIRGESNRSQILRIAPDDATIFIRKKDDHLERLER